MPQLRWTLVFIAACIVAFVWQSIVGPEVLVYFAFFPAKALYAPWTLVTSIFLHANLLHLVFNMFALFTFGLYLERLIGRSAFLTLFLLAGVVGNLGYAFTALDPFTPAVGASGAIYGVIGTLAVLRPKMLVFVGGLPMPLVLAALFWALLDLAGLFVPTGIAHGAHLAGLAVGIAYGAYIRRELARRWYLHFEVSEWP